MSWSALQRLGRCASPPPPCYTYALDAFKYRRNVRWYFVVVVFVDSSAVAFFSCLDESIVLAAYSVKAYSGARITIGCRALV